MRIRSLGAALLIAAGVFAMPAAHAAGNAAQGKIKSDTCIGCHGIPDYTNAYPTYRVPKLGGQQADYIVAALQAYKSGARAHKTMHAQAATLSDQDMQDIAAYFSSLGKPVAAGAKPDSSDAAGAKKVSQVCAMCHGPNGSKPIAPTYPILAGQYDDYIRQVLNEYHDGERSNPTMKGQVASLSDQDIKDVAAYLSSVPSPLTNIPQDH